MKAAKKGCLLVLGLALAALVGLLIMVPPSSVFETDVVVLNETGQTVVVTLGEKSVEVPTGEYRRVAGVSTRRVTGFEARTTAGEKIESFEIQWSKAERNRYRNGLSYNVAAKGRFYAVGYDAFYERGPETRELPPGFQPKPRVMASYAGERLIPGIGRLYDEPLPKKSKKAVTRRDRVPPGVPEDQVVAYLLEQLRRELQAEGDAATGS